MTRAAVAVASAGLLAIGAASPTGSQPVVSEPLAEGLVGPLGLAVDDADGTVYVSQSFADPSVLTGILDGDVFVAAESPVGGAGVSGVSARDGVIVFTVSNPEADPPVGQLRRVDGPVSELIFDTAEFEAAENPDQVNSYGFQGLTDQCADEVAAALPDDPSGGKPYNGIVDSNPYGIASLPDGGWVVADAGGNDLVRVDENGDVQDVVVLPPVPLLVPDGAPGIPECAWGSTYNFEPVPTDVEIGPDGRWYVTSLPGGPEDPSLGARGVVWGVDPDSGDAEVVAAGFAGATGLAITPDGTIYVAELFGNRISQVVDGTAQTYVELESPATVEYADGVLFASIRALPGGEGPPNGAVVTISLPEPVPTTSTTATPTTTGARAATARPAFTG